MLVNLRLKPELPLRIEYKDVIDDAFFAVAFASAKDYEELAELGGGVTVSGAGGRPIYATRLRGRLLLTAICPGRVIGRRLRADVPLQTHIRAIAAPARIGPWHIRSCIDFDHIPAEFDHFVGLVGQAVALLPLD